MYYHGFQNLGDILQVNQVGKIREGTVLKYSHM